LSLKTEHGLEVEADASFDRKNFRWPEVSKLLASGDSSFGPTSWGYLGSNTRSRWPQAASLLFAHESRKKDRPADFRGLCLWTKHPEAVLDMIVRALWSKEWTGTSSPVPAGVVAESGVVIGPDCQIGEGTILETGVRLGARVRIGRHCRIGAHSRIADECVIGDFAQLSGFNSIGAQGFGLVDFPQVPKKRPRLHVGRAVVGKGVRLGAYVSIDRAVFGETVVSDYVAIDNHTQVGHNSTIGESSVILGFVAISGSTRIGERVVISGLTGTAGHLSIGNDVVIAAQSGITGDVPDGAQLKGYPARPLREALKIAALQTKLPEIYDRLRALEDKSASPEDET
jgi:UDP-3-O-[3-hydroxymyristoyl] glucosamine N-acyltransferase LpxD